MGFALPDVKPHIESAKQYPGIHIIPVLGTNKQNVEVRRFLWEGLADKSVEIKERQNVSVPSVTVVNHSTENFLGYRGSVIRGGGQNRQLLHSFVLSKGVSMDIPVQCIQHGRWNPHQSKSFSNKPGDVTSSSLRFSRKTQEETWHTIHETSVMSGTTSCTDDYTVASDTLVGNREEMAHATSQLTSTDRHGNEVRERSRSRAQTIIQDWVKNIPNQLGLYVIMLDPFEWKSGNMKLMHCLELFVSPELYEKAHKDLISSFAIDAALLPQDEISQHFYEEKMPPEIDTEMFNKLLEKIRSAPWQQNRNIGSESRHETDANHAFGEAISQSDTMLHLMYSCHE
jgi:hypothetical protein